MSTFARVLVFAPRENLATKSRDKGIFDVLWLSLLMLPNPAKGRAAIKQAKRVRSDLRAISEKIGSDGPDENRTLAVEGGKVVISEEDFRWLGSEVEAIEWRGGNVEEVSDTYDFLDASQKIKASDILKVVPEQPPVEQSPMSQIQPCADGEPPVNDQ